MASELEELLRFDPLSRAEEITGNEYKADGATTALGMLLAQRNSAEKRRLLAASNDAHWGSTVSEYIAIIEDIGFVEILNESIPGTEDRYRIYWRDGVLLCFDSYWGEKSINSAKCYCQFQGPRNALYGCSSGFIGGTDDDPVWYVDFDAREAVRHRLDSLSEAGDILGRWVKQPFLWLLHYRDTKQEGYDHKAINHRRMEAFPEAVREAICFAPIQETDQ